MDFTLTTYKKLLNSLQSRGFSFLTFAQYIELQARQNLTQPLSRAESSDQPHSSNPELQTSNSQPPTPQQINESTNQQNNNFESLNFESLNYIILRHDVDARPQNSLAFARIQAEMGISGTYYFRMVPQSYDEAIIKEMVELGHEVGYHYETMDTCKGNIDKAYDEFCRNLETFQKLTPVKTISMHGSPMSPYDNREIWKKYDYKKLGIIAEPYFDINFNELFYITDTGRRWDGHLYNVRDKATKENPLTNPHFLKLRFHTTFDLINAIEASYPEQRTINKEQRTNLSGDQRETDQQINSQQPIANSFPTHAMLNFHPQRWNDKPVPWLKELIWQNIKNQGKRLLLTLRK
jgi:hypothetical protein